MAGNVYEWTMEASYINNRILRGGYWYRDGSDYPVSSRRYDVPESSSSDLSFRLALYL